MKVLLADALPDAAVEQLEAAGDDVTRLPDLTAETLPDHIAGHEVLVVRSTKVTAPSDGLYSPVIFGYSRCMPS